MECLVFVKMNGLVYARSHSTLNNILKEVHRQKTTLAYMYSHSNKNHLNFVRYRLSYFFWSYVNGSEDSSHQISSTNVDRLAI